MCNRLTNLCHPIVSPNQIIKYVFAICKLQIYILQKALGGIGNKQTDIIEFLFHDLNDRFDGAGFDFERFPGE